MLSTLKYNVIVVNDFAHVEGGASQVAISSAIGLANQGHEVSYLSAVGPVASELRESPARVFITGQHAIAHDPSRIRAAIQGVRGEAEGAHSGRLWHEPFRNHRNAGRSGLATGQRSMAIWPTI